MTNNVLASMMKCLIEKRVLLCMTVESVAGGAISYARRVPSCAT